MSNITRKVIRTGKALNIDLYQNAKPNGKRFRGDLDYKINKRNEEFSFDEGYIYSIGENGGSIDLVLGINKESEKFHTLDFYDESLT